MKNILRNTQGFSLLEAVLATALIGLFLAASAVGFAYGVRATKDAGRKQQAVYLAEEGLAASQNIRDGAFANLVDGTWGLTTTANQWNFSGGSDVVDIFTRSITITDAGASQKQVTSAVTWTDTAQRSQSIALETYLTDWRSATTTPWSSLALAGTLDISGNQDMDKVQTAGNYAYMIRSSNSTTNFYVIDISTPTAPTLTGSLALNGTPNDVVISGNYAYVVSTDNSQELQVVSIVTPSAPALAASYNASGSANANGVALHGGYLVFVRDTSSAAEVFVMNIANPLLPTLTGSLNLTSSANDVAVGGSYAYVASTNNSQELQVVNLTTPSVPALLGGYDLSGSSADANTVAVDGTDVYLGIASSLYILNSSVPASPTLRATLAQGGTVNDISLMTGTDYVCIASSFGTGEFRLVDVATPASPTFLDTVDLAAAAYGVTYSSTHDIVIIADSDNSGEVITLHHP
jgi:hypothetical protein